MDRINRILEHPVWQECIRKNEMAEAERSFCHHDMEHLCAVGRIAMLLNLEEELELKKDIVYGAALLHDCGRYLQYGDGIPHARAGAEIAQKILPECGYDETETVWITEAILGHSGSLGTTGNSVLADVLYRADKMSRNCRVCKMYTECNWKEELKTQKFMW